jgi:SAM-dependent methyltransferase
MEILTPEGRLEIEELGDGLRRLRVVPRPGLPTSERRTAVTRYPMDLVQLILSVKGVGWTLDEIARDEDPSYVASTLRCGLDAYLDPETLHAARILDYGCGSGASTGILARMYPQAGEVVGADFVTAFHRIAEARCSFYGDRRRRHVLQASPNDLGPVGCDYDLLVLSAVIEHMLPEERSAVLPALARLVRVGGYIFVSDTPHRWFPIEAHTTNLWFLNYQSAPRALRRARRSANTGYDTWPEMLRAGIRGSTEREMLQCLAPAGGSITIRMVRPRYGRSRADIWHAGLTPGRYVVPKWIAKHLLDLGEKVTGSLLTQNVMVCFQRVT